MRPCWTRRRTASGGMGHCQWVSYTHMELIMQACIVPFPNFQPVVQRSLGDKWCTFIKVYWYNDKPALHVCTTGLSSMKKGGSTWVTHLYHQCDKSYEKTASDMSAQNHNRLTEGEYGTMLGRKFRQGKGSGHSKTHTQNNPAGHNVWSFTSTENKNGIWGSQLRCEIC